MNYNLRPASNQVQNHCLFLIENNQHREAVTLLRNVIINKAHFELCVQLSKEVNQELSQFIAPTEYRDVREVQSTRLASQLIQLGQNLPDDHAIVRDRIAYELNNGKDFSEAYQMVSFCYGMGTVNFARTLNQQIDNFQEVNLESSGDDGDVYEFSQVIDRSGKRLLEYLEEATDFDGHNTSGFIKAFLTDRRFVPSFREAKDSNTDSISPYFADIQRQPNEVKRHLLLWEEQFLIGNYEVALDHAEAARVGELATTSLNYEYTLLAYLSKHTRC